MRFSHGIASLLLAVILTVIASARPARADVDLVGRLGADYSDMQFENLLQSREESVDIRRSLANQFLEMTLMGPFLSSNFGHYSTSVKLNGAYYRVEAVNGSASEYTNPELSGFNAQLGLFAGRRYPVNLQYSKSKVYALRYESTNRARPEQANPELAAVRRYDADVTAMSAQLKYDLGENSNLDFDLTRTNSLILRRYDFREQQDIAARFQPLGSDPTASFQQIVVENSVPEGAVTLVIDLQVIHELQPGERFEFELETGVHEVEFIPESFNPYRATVNVEGDMLWRLAPTPPPGQKDLDEQQSAAYLNVELGKDQPLSSRTVIRAEDRQESFEDRTIQSFDLSNDIDYSWTWSRRLRSSLLWSDIGTTFSGKEDRVQMLSHNGSLSYTPSRKRQAEIRHLFMRTNTMTGQLDPVVANENRLASRWTEAIGPLGHVANARLDFALRGESTGQDSREVLSELKNKADFAYVGLGWRPETTVGYKRRVVENPDSDTAEFSFRSMVESTRDELWKFGQLKTKAEWGLRRKSDGVTLDATKRWHVSGILRRPVGSFMTLRFSASRDREIYDLELVEDNGIPLRVRPPETKSNLKVDFFATPVAWMSIQGGATRAKTTRSQSESLFLSGSVRVPRLNIPIKTLVMSEKRQIEGQREQTNLSVETTATFSVRKVAIVFTHILKEETLPNEDYAYQEFRMEVLREFSLF